MSRRTLAWIVIALAGAVALAGLAWSIFGESRLVFTQAELQAQLDRALPRTVREVTIERGTVTLADNRLALRLELKAAAARQPVTAVVSARGLPRYQAESGELYFDADDVKVEQITIAGRLVTGDDDGAGGRVVTAARATVQRLAESAIKAWLAARPVYRLKDDVKGVVLKATLVDVTVAQGTLAVTFSLWHLTVTAAIFAALIVVLLLAVWWLIRHPLWGIRVAAELSDLA